MELVGAEGQEIDTERLHLDGEFAGDLNGVGVGKDALAATDGGDFLDGEHDAGLVVGVHDRDDGGVGSDGLFEDVEVEGAIGLDGEIGDFEALFFEVFAEVDVGGVLDLGGDDVAFAGGDEGGLEGGVVGLGAAAGEEDFAGIGTDEGGDLFPGLFDVTVDLGAEGVGAGGVTPVFAQEGDHGVDHFWGDPGGGVVIEIIDLLLLHKTGILQTGRNCSAMLPGIQMVASCEFDRVLKRRASAGGALAVQG